MTATTPQNNSQSQTSFDNPDQLQQNNTSQSNGQPKSTKNVASDKHNKKKLTDAEATILAAVIGAIGAGIFGYGVFSATQHYQDDDGRQKALNEYTTSMKELIVSSDIERTNSQMVADLQDSRTFLVMRELEGDGDRKGQVLRFLHETCLIKTEVGAARCVRNLLEQELQQARENLRMAKVDLSGIDLDEVDLQDASVPNIDLHGAYMRGANLQKAALSGADLRDANLAARPKSSSLPSLKPSNLQGAKLKWAVFVRANLMGVNLSKADLSSANLQDADLRKATLTNAILAGTKLDGACYVKGTEARYFPPGFNPKEHNMIAIPEDQSDPNEPATFKPCPKVSTPYF